ncbi:MAG: hypothetical protein Q9188_006260 [Gyalolechia gomerana]
MSSPAPFNSPSDDEISCEYYSAEESSFQHTMQSPSNDSTATAGASSIPMQQATGPSTIDTQRFETTFSDQAPCPSADELGCSPLSSDLDSDQFSPTTRQKCELPSLAAKIRPEQRPKTPIGLDNVSLLPPDCLAKSIDWTEALLIDLVQTMESTFPWEEFGARHGISVEFLRSALRELVVTPLCLSSEDRLQDFFDRVQQYDLARKEYHKHVSRQEREEARDLREYNKLKLKEAWKEKKAILKKELELLRTASRDDERAQAAIECQKAVIREAKRQRKAQKAAEKEVWKAKLSQMPDIDNDESAEEEI